MPRRRQFLPESVVDAARVRLRHVYDTFDDVWLQFSGGKDSTACLYLMKELHEERGLGPVKVIFRDEEMISPSVERYVQWVRDQDWVEMEWYCLPHGQEVWVLGRREFCLLWSKWREDDGRLFRPIPEGAITAEDFGLDRNEPIQQPIDYYTMQGKRGRVAFVTGVRANESMMRYRTVVQKLSENYINRPYGLSKAIPMRFAKVIYDWTSDDVYKYIYDQGAPYCEYYDYAAISGANQRVGIPLHSVASRRIEDVVRTEPEFYDRLVDIFPQIDAQRRIWREFDIEALIRMYADEGWDGVKACITDNMLTPGFEQAAKAFVAKYRKKHINDPFSYPIDHLIRTLLLQEFLGTAPSPVGPKTRAHAVRMAEMDADSLDLQDDRR